MSRVDRRRFLLASSAAVGLAAVAPRSLAAPVAIGAPSAPRGMRKLQKAVKYGMVEEGKTVLEKFRLLKDLGFDGVEMDSPSDLDPAEVLAARDATGLAIPGVVDSVHWSQTLGDPDAAVRERGRAALETALRDCKRYGGTSALLVPAVVNERIGYDEAYSRSQAEIQNVLPLAAELRVSIALENVWNDFLLSPLEAARYVDELASPWVGWHLDPGNLVAYGWPEHWVRVLGKRILKLDVKDYSRKKRDEQGRWKGFEVEIGEGDTNWPSVMRALDEIGYAGWAAAEVAGGGRERLRQIKERMDRWIDG